MNDVVVVSVLGMHRSGTSCLTGCLQDCGLHLGKVVTNNWDNLKGNRESLAIRAINDEVLKFSGGAWSAPPQHLTWNDAHRRSRDEAIASRSMLEIWGFKDPRTLLTLPFWLEALPALRLVGTFRHPLAVANSLSQRDNIPETHVLALWHTYNEKLLQYVCDFDMPLVCFDWPVDRYIQAVLRIARSLDLKKCTSRETVSFFDNDLRKHSDPPSTQDLEGKTEALYYELLSRSLAPDEDNHQDVNLGDLHESVDPNQV